MGAIKNQIIEDTENILKMLAWDGVEDTDENFDRIQEIIVNSSSTAVALLSIGIEYGARREE